jgi:hypothetical protein
MPAVVARRRGGAALIKEPPNRTNPAPNWFLDQRGGCPPQQPSTPR